MTRACEDRVALVTGASRGIGAAIARRLAAEGASVALVARSAQAEDSPLPGSLRKTAQEIVAAGGIAETIAADLADPETNRAALVAAAESALGPIDILVNGAAALFAEPFDELTEKRVRLALEVNVVTPWAFMAAVAPGMRARGRGWIVNLTSRLAHPPAGPPFVGGQLAGGALYGGTKAMLDRMTVGAASDLWGAGVAVNGLAPEAAVRTAGADALVSLPADRVEPVETMVEAALALATADPTALTGRVTTSLRLLVELDRAVHDLAGQELVSGWQPSDIAHRLGAPAAP